MTICPARLRRRSSRAMAVTASRLALAAKRCGEPEPSGPPLVWPVSTSMAVSAGVSLMITRPPDGRGTTGDNTPSRASSTPNSSNNGAVPDQASAFTPGASSRTRRRASGSSEMTRQRGPDRVRARSMASGGASKASGALTVSSKAAATSSRRASRRSRSAEIWEISAPPAAGVKVSPQSPGRISSSTSSSLRSAGARKRENFMPSPPRCRVTKRPVSARRQVRRGPLPSIASRSAWTRTLSPSPTASVMDLMRWSPDCRASPAARNPGSAPSISTKAALRSRLMAVTRPANTAPSTPSSLSRSNRTWTTVPLASSATRISPGPALIRIVSARMVILSPPGTMPRRRSAVPP